MNYSLADFKNPVKPKPTASVRPSTSAEIKQTQKTQAINRQVTQMKHGYNEMGKIVLADAAIGKVISLGASAVGKAIGSVAGRIAGDAAEASASKGLSASGMGGRLSVSQGVEGPVLTSTQVGTSAQQSARMRNLGANAMRIGTETAASTGATVANSVAGSAKSAGQMALKGAEIAAIKKAATKKKK